MLVKVVLFLAPLAMAFPAPQIGFAGSLGPFSGSIGPNGACAGIPGASGCIGPDYACGRNPLGSACISLGGFGGPGFGFGGPPPPPPGYGYRPYRVVEGAEEPQAPEATE